MFFSRHNILQKKHAKGIKSTNQPNKQKLNKRVLKATRQKIYSPSANEL